MRFDPCFEQNCKSKQTLLEDETQGKSFVISTDGNENTMFLPKQKVGVASEYNTCV